MAGATMSAENPITLSARLSRRLSIEIKLSPPGRIDVYWLPAMPTRLSRKEMRAYRAARDKAVAQLAQQFGGSVVMIELQ
jgi:hypothetical protein